MQTGCGGWYVLEGPCPRSLAPCWRAVSPRVRVALPAPTEKGSFCKKILKESQPNNQPFEYDALKEMQTYWVCGKESPFWSLP